MMQEEEEEGRRERSKRGGFIAQDHDTVLMGRQQAIPNNVQPLG
jgi:hypothetical protein